MDVFKLTILPKDAKHAARRKIKKTKIETALKAQYKNKPFVIVNTIIR